MVVVTSHPLGSVHARFLPSMHVTLPPSDSAWQTMLHVAEAVLQFIASNPLHCAGQVEHVLNFVPPQNPSISCGKQFNPFVVLQALHAAAFFMQTLSVHAVGGPGTVVVVSSATVVVGVATTVVVGGSAAAEVVFVVGAVFNNRIPAETIKITNITNLLIDSFITIFQPSKII